MNMTVDEKLDILLKEMQGFKAEMQEMKAEMQEMKAEMQEMKAEMQEMKAEMQKMDKRITSIELHLENVTDKNLALLAENHVNLVNKLDEAITASNKAILCEVQVRMLTERVGILENDVACLKSAKA